MELIDRIRELCRQRGISVTNLEIELNFGNGSLTRTNNIRADRLKKVADYFGVSTDYLLGVDSETAGWYENSETAKMAQDIFENPNLRILMDASRKLSPDDLARLTTIAEALKNEYGNMQND